MISPTGFSTQLSVAGSYIMQTTPRVSILANALSNYASINSFNRIGKPTSGLYWQDQANILWLSIFTIKY